ncbi:MAG: hypothetical protein ACRC0G_02525, partial [Fusobacteriaceae bacterium]
MEILITILTLAVVVLCFVLAFSVLLGAILVIISVVSDYLAVHGKAREISKAVKDKHEYEKKLKMVEKKLFEL